MHDSPQVMSGVQWNGKEDRDLLNRIETP